jgi:hypothetical protein
MRPSGLAVAPKVASAPRGPRFGSLAGNPVQSLPQAASIRTPISVSVRSKVQRIKLYLQTVEKSNHFQVAPQQSSLPFQLNGSNFNLINYIYNLSKKATTYRRMLDLPLKPLLHIAFVSTCFYLNLSRNEVIGISKYL